MPGELPELFPFPKKNRTLNSRHLARTSGGRLLSLLAISIKTGVDFLDSRDGISTWQVRTISEGDKAFCMNLFLKMINNLRDSFLSVSQMLQRIFQEQSESGGLF